MSVDAAGLLRQQGLNVTPQRLAVLRAVSGRPHLTADDVFEVVRADIGTISRRAVYDAVGVTPCLTAADDSGYEIDEAEVIYWGRCPACRLAADAT